MCPEIVGPSLIDPAQVTIEDTGDICLVNSYGAPTMFQGLFQVHQKPVAWAWMDSPRPLLIPRATPGHGAYRTMGLGEQDRYRNMQHVSRRISKKNKAQREGHKGWCSQEDPGGARKSRGIGHSPLSRAEAHSGPHISHTLGQGSSSLGLRLSAVRQCPKPPYPVLGSWV